MGKACRNITTRDESKMRFHFYEDNNEVNIQLDSNQNQVDENENEFYVKKPDPIASTIENNLKNDLEN